MGPHEVPHEFALLRDEGLKAGSPGRIQVGSKPAASSPWLAPLAPPEAGADPELDFVSSSCSVPKADATARRQRIVKTQWPSLGIPSM